MSNTQTAIILVTDVVGSTRQRSELGEDAAEELRRRHDGLVGDAVVAHDGTVVKSLGDGVLARFAGAADAVAAAVTAQQNLDGEFDVRIGISAGDVTLEDGDCFGTPVIEAARLCAEASGGQILVADLARMLARGRGGFAFRPIGDLELKGLPEPVGVSEVSWEHVRSASVPFPVALRPGGFPYAGRVGVLERVTQMYKEAAEGESRVLLLSGEPGMGKTRLSCELASKAADAGAIVLFGRSEEEVVSAYRSITEALTPLVVAMPDEQIEAHVAEFAGALSTVVPALRARVPDVGVPEGPTGEVRAMVFDAVTDIVRRQATTAPVVVVLDDLHWADDATLLLLKHLARAPLGPVLIIGTYRDTDLIRGHQLGAVLADLRRVDIVERVDLHGLTEVEVAELMVRAGGHELDERGLELAAVVRRESDGNPFFVGEILNHLAESGAIYESEGRWVSDAASAADLGVPQGIREVVGRRLDALSDDANGVLRTAAVIGQEFDLKVLAHALGDGVDHVIDVLDVALARGLVAEIPGEVDRIRFPHALVRQTLYEELSASRRVRLHARVADAHLATPSSTPAEQAHHLLEAAAVIDPARVVEASIAACREATEAFAADDAVEWVDRAIDALVDLGEDRPDLLARLLDAKAVALVQIDLRRSRETLREAAALARRAGDPELLAEVALDYALAGSAWLDLDDTLGLELALEAKAALPGHPSPARARALVAEANLSVQSPEPTVVMVGREAYAMVRDHALDLLPEAVAAYGEVLRGSPEADELIEVGRQLRSVEFTNRPVRRHYGLYWECLGRMKQGRFQEVDALASEMLEAATRTRTPLLAWQGRSALPGLSANEARWDDAEERLAHYDEIAELMGDTGIGISYFLRCLLARSTGDIDAFRAAFDELVERVPSWGLWDNDAVAGEITGTVAPAELSRRAESWFTGVFPLLPQWVVPTGIALMAGPFRHGPPALARQALARVEPQAGRWICAGVNQHEAHASWTLGALAEGSGDLDRAITEYDRARQAHEEAGEIPARAGRSRWLVEALVSRNQAADLEQAKRVAGEVADIADRVGIAGLADRVTAIVD